MMHGYDKDAAVAFITRCIRKADHPELPAYEEFGDLLAAIKAAL